MSDLMIAIPASAGILAIGYALLILCARAKQRQKAETERRLDLKIGPRQIAPDGRFFRVSKEVRLSGDVWYRVDLWGWGSGGGWGPYLEKEFATADEAETALAQLFDRQRRRLNASRAPVIKDAP